MTHRSRSTILFKMTTHGLASFAATAMAVVATRNFAVFARRFLFHVTELHGFVTIFFRRLTLHDRTRSALNNGDGNGIAFSGKHRSHADFAT